MSDQEQRGYGDEHDTFDAPRVPSKRRFQIAIIVAFLLGALGLIAFVGILVYFGNFSPEKMVCGGEEVRAEYIQTLREMGALEPDEELVYFYSGGSPGIEDGFSFVSDHKVAVYVGEDGVPEGEGLTMIPFDRIESTDLERDPSFRGESSLCLILTDGDELQFPLSSTMGVDLSFCVEINIRMKRARER